MRNADQQIPSQPNIFKYKTTILLFIIILFTSIVSGMVGYVLGQRASPIATCGSQRALQPIPSSRVSTITTPSPTSIPSLIVTITFSPAPSSDKTGWKPYIDTTFGATFQYP